MAVDVLVVDDEADICDLVSGILEDEGYAARAVTTGLEALHAIHERQPGLVLLDVWLGDGAKDGLAILERMKRDHPYVPVVMMSGHGTVETAVAAIKLGAYDFIEKPFQTDRLLLVVQRAIESSKLKRENDELRARAPFLCSLVGTSHEIQEIKQKLDSIAPTNSRICIHGPIGCDRASIARYVHNLSSRADQPFLAMNCLSVPMTQIETELFGFEPLSPEQTDTGTGAEESREKLVSSRGRMEEPCFLMKFQYSRICASSFGPFSSAWKLRTNGASAACLGRCAPYCWNKSTGC